MARRRKLVVGLSGLALSACAGSPAEPSQPDWQGPPVACRELGDRGLAIELTAPTGGHQFALVDVVASGETADVNLVHRRPTADFVTQVVTAHRVDVASQQLGLATQVRVWISSDGGPRQLAATLGR
jgi:hypothetical protein